MALMRGEESDRSYAGALLLADGLQTVRAFGSVEIHWRWGRDD
jgi:hypothetical protein